MKKFILIAISILIFLNLALSLINLYTYIKYTKQVINDIAEIKTYLNDWEYQSEVIYVEN